MTKLCDMHTHSRSSHDSVATVLEMAEAFIKNNAYAFCVTDHCDIEIFDESNAFSLTEASYKEASEVSKLLCGKIKVLRGVEIGESLWDIKNAFKILDAFDFDLVIGSVHAVRYKIYTMPYSTIDFSKMTDIEINEYLNLYFDELLDTMRLNIFDIMAHLTCPLRYINGKYGLNIDSKKYESKIIPILEYVIKNDIAMEINTSGIGTNFGVLMPENWIIKKFKEMGGHIITLGSDAHAPENVLKGFDDTIKTLKEYGFDGYYYYEKRKKIKVEI